MAVSVSPSALWVAAAALLALGLCVAQGAELREPQQSLGWPWSKPDYHKSIKYYLITKDSPRGVNVDYTVDSLLRKGFDKTKSLTVIIHGYGHNINNAEVIHMIGPALLDAAVPTNVLAVDWGTLCRKPWYPQARNRVQPVGVEVARYLSFLVGNGLARLTDVHIIGHSLGAHVAGIVGQHFESKIAHITALDPAAPLFFTWNSDRITASDAIFVDAVHTCIGLLGLKLPVGHVDFYPNEGRIFQPGCSMINDVFNTGSNPLHLNAKLPDFTSGSCSHDRAFELYAESITNPTAFPTTACDSYEEAVSAKCTSKEGGSPVYMGYSVKPTDRGYYYLQTRGSTPYSMNTNQ